MGEHPKLKEKKMADKFTAQVVVGKPIFCEQRFSSWRWRVSKRCLLSERRQFWVLGKANVGPSGGWCVSTALELLVPSRPDMLTTSSIWRAPWWELTGLRSFQTGERERGRTREGVHMLCRWGNFLSVFKIVYVQVNVRFKND